MFSDFTSRDYLRYAGFLVLNIAMAVYGSYQAIKTVTAVEFLPFFVPMIFISTAAFALLYPILRRLRPGVARFVALYIAFVSALLLLVLAQALIIIVNSLIYHTSPLPQLASMGQMLMLILFFGHMFGFPALLVIAAVNKVFSPVFFPRSADV